MIYYKDKTDECMLMSKIFNKTERTERLIVKYD